MHEHQGQIAPFAARDERQPFDELRAAGDGAAPGDGGVANGTDMVEPRCYRNLVFISYSRRAEAPFARRLQADLEAYRIPTALECDRTMLSDGRWLRPVFRDQTDLDSRNEPFWDQIEQHIAASRYLLLVCSPTAARSPNVDREVRCFLASSADALDRLMPIVVAGDVGAGNGANRCLPESLLPHQSLLAQRHLPEGTREEILLRVVSWIMQVSHATLLDRHNRRRKRSRAMASVVALIVLAAVATTLVYADQERRAAAAATAETDRQKQLVALEHKAAERNDYFGQVRLAAGALAQGDPAGARVALDRCPEPLRTWEWGYLDNQVDQSVVRLPCSDGPAPIAASPDGLRVAVCLRDGGLCVHRLDDSSQVLIAPPDVGVLDVVAWSSDGAWLATAAQTGDIAVWRVEDGSRVCSVSNPRERIRQLQFRGDGSALFYSGKGGAVHRLDLPSGARVGRPMMTVNPAGRFDSDATGTLIAALDEDGSTLRMFDAATTKLRWRRPRVVREAFRDIDFSPDGNRLLVATDGGGAWLADAHSGNEVVRVGDTSTRVLAARFLQDGSWICLGLADGTLQVFTFAAAGDGVRHHANVQAHRSRLSALHELEPAMVVSACDDGQVSVTALPTGRLLGQFIGHTKRVGGAISIRRAQDDTHATGSVATWSADGSARVWTLARMKTPTGRATRDALGDMRLGVFPRAIVPSPDSRLGVLRDARAATSVDLVSLPDQTLVASLDHGAVVGAIAFSPDSALLVTGSRASTAKLWAADGTLRRDLEGHDGPVTAVAWSADGKTVATGSEDRAVRVFEASSGALVAKFDHDAMIRTITFANTGSLLASGDDAGMVLVWDLVTQARVATLAGHGKAVVDLEFASTSALLLSASHDGTARLWDPMTGTALRNLLVGRIVVAAALNPAATRVVTLADVGEIAVWDVETGVDIIRTPLTIDQGLSAQFSEDGMRLVITGGLGEVLTLVSSRR